MVGSSYRRIFPVPPDDPRGDFFVVSADRRNVFAFGDFAGCVFPGKSFCANDGRAVYREESPDHQRRHYGRWDGAFASGG